MVTHVNPGGAAETRAGAMLVNSLCASSPVNFIRRLEVAAQKLMHELQDSAHVVKHGDGARVDGGGTPLTPPPPPPSPPQPQPPEVKRRRSVGGIDESAEGAPVAPGGSFSAGGTDGIFCDVDKEDAGVGGDVFGGSRLSE